MFQNQGQSNLETAENTSVLWLTSSVDTRHGVELRRASGGKGFLMVWRLGGVFMSDSLNWNKQTRKSEVPTCVPSNGSSFMRIPTPQNSHGISGLKTSFVSSSWANFRSACAAPLEPFESDGWTGVNKEICGWCCPKPSLLQAYQ